jgi:Zn-dependent protease with chaperone function
MLRNVFRYTVLSCALYLLVRSFQLVLSNTAVTCALVVAAGIQVLFAVLGMLLKYNRKTDTVEHVWAHALASKVGQIMDLPVPLVAYLADEDNNLNACLTTSFAGRMIRVDDELRALCNNSVDVRTNPAAGVFAHELAHQRHLRVAVYVRFVNIVAVTLRWTTIGMIVFTDVPTARGLAVAFVAPILLRAVTSSVSRACEQEADRVAHQHGFGVALGHALDSARRREEKTGQSKVTKFFGTIGWYRRSHPNINRRIRALVALS